MVYHLAEEILKLYKCEKQQNKMEWVQLNGLNL